MREGFSCTLKIITVNIIWFYSVLFQRTCSFSSVYCLYLCFYPSWLRCILWTLSCWTVPLFFPLPSQLYVAYQNGKVEQALSLGFLLCWLAGDLTNFIGCYLTNQLPIQVNFTRALVLYIWQWLIFINMHFGMFFLLNLL